MLAGTWVATPEGAALLALFALILGVREWRTKRSHNRAIAAMRAMQQRSADEELPRLDSIYVGRHVRPGDSP